MAVRTGALEERDDTLRRIARAGQERVTGEQDNGDGTVTITTDRLTDAKRETR